MIVIFDNNKQKWPIKAWVSDIGQLEAECLKQAVNLSNLPFIYKWVALMPDVHSGYGMPIGGVIAAKDIIIPNAVGVDIGCGMCFVQTDIPIRAITEVDTPNGKLAQQIIGNILRNIPTAFEHYSTKQECIAADRFLAEIDADRISGRNRSELPSELMEELKDAYFQVGTLGGGNHFIELQTDDDGYLGIMIHSGSRNLGYKICNYFNEKAKEINRQKSFPIPEQWDLAFLETDSEIGKEYIRWMKLALDFAKENREHMMKRTLDIIGAQIQRYAGIAEPSFSEMISCHHNYASFEEHYGNYVWVHRKGAIRVRKGELGIIPGAMGTYSYVVEGKGNPESFESSSHGAGRCMSRHSAREKFSVESTINDLKSLGVFLGKKKKLDVSEESRFAYKFIDEVLANESDLVIKKIRLKTIAVVKG